MKIGAKSIASELPLPKQWRRSIPACCALLLFVLLTTSFGRSDSVFLYKRNAHFPKKIWQTWKVDPLGFEEKDKAVARTWTAKNPNYRWEIITDANDLEYVETHFGPNGLNRLDIVYMYRELTARIIKADLLRYMVMYVEGGVYTDIDVEALRPIGKFIPERYNERDIDMVVGIEIDQPEFKDHEILGKKCMSFCQWTFMAKPGLPVMLTLIENIIRWLKDVAMEQRVPISGIQLDFDQVISGTGPSAFTKAIMEDMSRRAGRKITWESFHNIGESKLVENVLVLTVEAFAAGQGHSDSGNHNAKQALVKHHYHASGWPTSHPRYNHPIHGEVERCNWDPICVKQWDDNKAAFEALPEEEQQAQIALKQGGQPGQVNLLPQIQVGESTPNRKRQTRRTRPR
jgi:mannosyltransferase OCH1-like enzyme